MFIENRINKIIYVYGFISELKTHGKYIFFNILNSNYSLQVIITNKNKFYLKYLKEDYFVKVLGLLKNKKEENYIFFRNLGNIEIFLINFLNITYFISFKKFLKNKIFKKRAILKSKLIVNIVKFLKFEKFVYLETPILTRYNFEGSKAFIIPLRKKRIFMSLTQSPQIFKQLLMVFGFSKYFQISKCFRDEDLKKNRINEFLQLDLEISNSSNLDLIILLENLLIFIISIFFNNFSNFYKFSTIFYKDCKNLFLKDKLDLRLKTSFKIINFNLYLKIKKKFYIFNYLNFIFKIGYNFKTYLFLLKLINNLKYFYIFNKYFIFNFFNLKKNANVFIFEILTLINFNFFFLSIITHQLISYDFIKSIISLVGVKNFDNFWNFNIFFVWILNFPVFKYSKTLKKYKIQNNPFSKIIIIDLIYLDLNPLKPFSKSYDLVINNLEIVSGSSRNEKFFLQKKIFLITINKYEYNFNYKYFIKFFKLATPNHTGFGLGLDRFLCFLTGIDSLKNLLVFYKYNFNNYNLKLPSFIF